MPSTYIPNPILDTSFQYPSDGDLANVASLIMLLDLADASKYFADLLDGTSTGVVLQDPAWTGVLSSDPSGTIIASGGGSLASLTANGTGAIVVGTFEVTGQTDLDGNLVVDGDTNLGGHLIANATAVTVDKLHSLGAVTFDTTLNVTGLATLDSVNIDGGAIIGDSSLFSFTTTPVRIDGILSFLNTGRFRYNSIAGSASTHTYALGDGQIIMVPTLAGNIDYTLSETGADEGDWFLISMTADTTSANSNGVTVKRGVDATQIGPSVVKGGAAGTVEWMLVVYRNGRWQPALWGAPHA